MKKDITVDLGVKEAGKKGGRITLERYGHNYFKIIGRRGGQRTKELYGHLFCEFGRKGGRPRKPDMKLEI